MLNVKLTGEVFAGGVGTVGTSAARLTPVPFDAGKGVYIKCTAGTIYVGNGKGVSAANGYPLIFGGDDAVTVAVDDPNKVWVIGDAGGRTYKWLAS